MQQEKKHEKKKKGALVCPEGRSATFIHPVQCQSLNLKPVTCLGAESEKSKHYTYLNVTDRHSSEEADPEPSM